MVGSDNSSATQVSSTFKVAGKKRLPTMQCAYALPSGRHVVNSASAPARSHIEFIEELLPIERDRDGEPDHTGGPRGGPVRCLDGRGRGAAVRARGGNRHSIPLGSGSAGEVTESTRDSTQQN